ncbi:MAG: wax ester/triacylglycerol synthase family O-acyltransferase [Actinobacteria bacterium]|nr:wax ester/triacylglycerol synthase family O-acyltransferase [Actinomycetota bacterium]MCB9390061.1 wax ester/triacylglycerol synthase family O-acyltransferase [Acidimicrobiia bacterium]
MAKAKGHIIMQRLTGIDSAFAVLETPTNHMHVSSVLILDPGDMSGKEAFAAIREMIGQRIHLVPPFRRRLMDVPLNLDHPVWIDDPDFHLDSHLRHVALPSPGGHKELAALAARLFGRPLDRSRPLWEMWFVEGVKGDRCALISKVHHAAIDGVSGAELMVHMLDLEPSPSNPPNQPNDVWRPQRAPSETMLTLRSIGAFVQQPWRLAKVARTTVSSFRAMQHDNGDGVGTPPLFQAPRTPFNAALTPHRLFEYMQMPLDTVKFIKSTFGTTVNDVVMSVCAGGLRHYLRHIDEIPDRPLIASVPISVRSADESGALGNRISAMFTSLSTDIADPVERLMAVNEQMSVAKEQHHAVGANFLMDWAQSASPAVFARAARLYTSLGLANKHRPLYNVTISNVPGPPFRLYMAGMSIDALFPLGPIAEGAGLNITVMSYQDRMDFGIVGCRELTPDLHVLAQGMAMELEELRVAAEASAPGRPAQRKRNSATATRPDVMGMTSIEVPDIASEGVTSVDAAALAKAARVSGEPVKLQATPKPTKPAPTTASAKRSTTTKPATRAKRTTTKSTGTPPKRTTTTKSTGTPAKRTTTTPSKRSGTAKSAATTRSAATTTPTQPVEKTPSKRSAASESSSKPAASKRTSTKSSPAAAKKTTARRSNTK